MSQSTVAKLILEKTAQFGAKKAADDAALNMPEGHLEEQSATVPADPEMIAKPKDGTPDSDVSLNDGQRGLDTRETPSADKPNPNLTLPAGQNCEDVPEGNSEIKKKAEAEAIKAKILGIQAFQAAQVKKASADDTSPAAQDTDKPNGDVAPAQQKKASPEDNALALSPDSLQKLATCLLQDEQGVVLAQEYLGRSHGQELARKLIKEAGDFLDSQSHAQVDPASLSQEELYKAAEAYVKETQLDVGEQIKSAGVTEEDAGEILKSAAIHEPYLKRISEASGDDAVEAVALYKSASMDYAAAAGGEALPGAPAEDGSLDPELIMGLLDEAVTAGQIPPEVAAQVLAELFPELAEGGAAPPMEEEAPVAPVA